MANELEATIKQLKAARRDKKYSQQTLAAELGIPQSHLSKIENGQVNITLNSLFEIAKSLDLEVLLIPKHKSLFINALIKDDSGAELMRPAYTLDDDTDDSMDDEADWGIKK